MFRKGISIGLMLLLVGVSIVPNITSNEAIKESYVILSYTQHDPIYINGNDNFTSENGVTEGSGTYVSPYIIHGWDINASSQHGITVRNVNVYFRIKNCYIHTGGIAKDGIVFKNVTHGVIEDNTIIDNRYGIIFRGQSYPLQENSSYNFIHHNNITNNAKDGIHFEHLGWSYHRCNSIYLNNITGNNQGIFMVMSAYNQIFSNNIILNSKMGVNLTKCMGGGANNKVYHNNFINNGGEDGQACVWWTLDNAWDDGYPSGGNFWSDYDGVDNFSGPHQNISGGDGIGDTPYNITLYWDEFEHDLYPFEYDYFPLMEPWGGNLQPFADFNWTPHLPEPDESIHFNASKSIDYDGNITLYEWDWDDDGEFDENHTNYTATHTWSSYGYYPVTLRITDNDNLTDSKRRIVRVGNQPPYEPSAPYPENGSSDIPLNAILSWTGGDPDQGDIVTYDVYFDTSYPPIQRVWNQSETSWIPNPELYTQQYYYWKIVSWDSQDASTEGPIWWFTTRVWCPPPGIDGPYNGKTGIEYDYEFYYCNPYGNPASFYIEWGDGNITNWTELYDSGEPYYESHSWSEDGVYTIRAKAKEWDGYETGWANLEVTMPKNQNMQFGWLERFPLLQRLLSLPVFNRMLSR